MITNIEVKRLNSERLRESSREKAEKYEVESRAERINSLNSFKALHSGYKAVEAGTVYFACEANDKAMLDFLEEQQLSVTLETLEYAFTTLTKSGSLAKFPKKQYVRKTDASGMPQQRSFAPPDKVAPYLRSEIIAMTKQQLQNAVKIFGIREINRILNQTGR